MRKREIYGMKFGISVSNLGIYSDFDKVIALARDAEEAGWDGIFLWDHILHKPRADLRVIDPWIMLAAIAVNTRRMKLGPMVTPLSRRRPWKVARESVSLDHLSKGRLILGVGLGSVVKQDFQRFGEEIDNRLRGEKLDEALEILQGLWKGEPYSFNGKHYSIDEGTTFLPKPYGDKNRVPIWVGGGKWSWRMRPFRRAARFEGTFPEFTDRSGGKVAKYFDNVAEYITRYRGNLSGFDFATLGKAPQSKRKIKEYFDPILKSGKITWWVERVYSWKGNLEHIKEKVREGPPDV
ncbi:LLM class flavin-dependent oxidoreductase [Candidatus Bathyarchaeota archaeon]|nr:LLM class flavin-dependent oxidoreductase [Candidatus Bathyarchaeota archaeon]